MLNKPLDALHGILPAKPLYVLGIFAYIFINLGLLFCSYAVDTPMMKLSENHSTSKKWANVSEYQIVNSTSVGEDFTTFAAESKTLH